MCIKTTVSVMATAILAVAACAPSPEGMLEELITTIDQGDLLRFEALVDVDAVVMDFSTEFRGRLERELGETIDDAEWSEIDTGLVRSAAAEVRAAVRERRLIDALLVDHLFVTVMAPDDERFDALQEPSVEVEGIDREGRAALVGLWYVHATGQGAYGVDLRLERGESAWRVVGLERVGPYLGEILTQLGELDRERTYLAAMQGDLRNLRSQQEIYYSDQYTYSDDLSRLAFVSSPGVEVMISAATDSGWAAVATHQGLPGRGCGTFYGVAEPVPTPGGRIVDRMGQTVCD